MLKDFTGAKLMYGNYYFLDPRGTDFFYMSTGLKGNYQAIMMFFAYYCYENKNTIETEGESGSNLQVDINNVFSLEISVAMLVYIQSTENRLSEYWKKAVPKADLTIMIYEKECISTILFIHQKQTFS